ncbi:hypothetical protein [Actinoallomurus sp. CA-142502]|uniref:hypothetical protein n=1 Tax=Actinoallomurus sp. CA-142502 TaxID=3239885 RepID=UPI003D91978B
MTAGTVRTRSSTRHRSARARTSVTAPASRACAVPQSPDLDGRPGRRHLVGRHPEQPGHGAWSQPHSDQRSALGE